MNNRLVLVGILVGVLVMVGGFLLRPRALPPADTTVSATPASPQAPPGATSAQSPSVGVAPSDAAAPGRTAAAGFQADATGRLVIDAGTRATLERLLGPDDAGLVTQVKTQLETALPKDAAAEAAELIDRFREYQTSARELYAPGAPPSEDVVLASLDSLHSLRVEHFGADVAEALFGPEEAQARARREQMTQTPAPSETEFTPLEPPSDGSQQPPAEDQR